MYKVQVPERSMELSERLRQRLEYVEALVEAGWRIPPSILDKARITERRWSEGRTPLAWVDWHVRSLGRVIRAAWQGDTRYPAPNWVEPYERHESFYLALGGHGGRRALTLEPGDLMRGEFVADDLPWGWDAPARFTRPRAFRILELTLTGDVGGWPFALYRATPETGFEPCGESCRASCFRIEERLPAHLALGPNGSVVARIIERIQRLSAVERTVLDARRARVLALEEAGDVRFTQARGAVRRVAVYGGLEVPVQWVEQGVGLPGAEGEIGYDLAGVAASAAVVRHLMSPWHLAVLTDAWISVTGEW